MKTYRGTDGDDTLTGTAADERFLPGLGDDKVNGEQGFDKLIVDYSGQATGSTTSYIVDYGAGAFYGVVSSGNNSTDFGAIESVKFTAGQGDDMLDVNATPLGQGAELNLDGGGGTDQLRIDFGALTDTRFVAGDDEHVSGNRGTFDNWESYIVTVGGGANTVTTGVGDDTITSQGGVGDRISAGDGNDTVYAYGATGHFDGGDGTDVFSGSYATTKTALTFNDASDTLSNGTKITNFENVELGTGSGDDVFNLSAPRYESLDGGAGRNTLNGDFSANTVTGYSGLGPTGGPDGVGFRGYLNNGSTASFFNMSVIHLTFGSGTDFVSVDAAPLASGATLKLDGGAGIDQLAIDFSALTDLTRFRDNGDGTVTSNRGSFSNFEFYDITLGTGHNVVVTGAGNDIVRVHSGDNKIDGGAGGDILVGDFSGFSDATRFVEHADGSVETNRGSYTNFESFQITGGGGDDHLAASGTLSGGGGDDKLVGGASDDTLIGGLGQDSLTGGAGSDTFRYLSVDDSPVGAATRDTIFDFTQGQDRIDLSALGSSSAPLSFIGDAQFHDVVGEVRYHNSTGATYIEYDMNGDGVSDMQIRLIGVMHLTSSDFILG